MAANLSGLKPLKYSDKTRAFQFNKFFKYFRDHDIGLVFFLVAKLLYNLLLYGSCKYLPFRWYTIKTFAQLVDNNLGPDDQPLDCTFVNKS